MLTALRSPQPTAARTRRPSGLTSPRTKSSRFPPWPPPWVAQSSRKNSSTNTLQKEERQAPLACRFSFYLQTCDLSPHRRGAPAGQPLRLPRIESAHHV